MRFPTVFLAPCIALGILLGTGPTWAGDPSADFTALQRTSLRGIDAVEVVVVPPQMVPGCDLLSGPQLEREVAARLHRAGIPNTPDPIAFLFLSVATVATPDTQRCAITVAVDLYQIVLLVRDIRLASVGVTWHQGTLGMAARADSVAHVQHMVAMLVDQFIGAYRD